MTPLPPEATLPAATLPPPGAGRFRHPPAASDGWRWRPGCRAQLFMIKEAALIEDVLLPEDDLEKLSALALSARQQAYAPYSGHPVGVALRTRNGLLFSGCNVENSAYPLSQCAEASAIGAMILSGERHITDVLVVGPGDVPCMPCGGCRQKIWEFADANTRVHICVSGRVVRHALLSELLPAAFGRQNNTPRV